MSSARLAASLTGPPEPSSTPRQESRSCKVQEQPGHNRKAPGDPHTILKRPQDIPPNANIPTLVPAESRRANNCAVHKAADFLLVYDGVAVVAQAAKSRSFMGLWRSSGTSTGMQTGTGNAKKQTCQSARSPAGAHSRAVMWYNPGWWAPDMGSPQRIWHCAICIDIACCPNAVRRQSDATMARPTSRAERAAIHRCGRHKLQCERREGPRPNKLRKRAPP